VATTQNRPIAAETGNQTELQISVESADHPKRSNDMVQYSKLLSQALHQAPVIRFLEYSLRADGSILALANAYRNQNREQVSRATLDSQFAELLRQATPTDVLKAQARYLYRSGDLRFVRGACEDPQVWTQFTGLKFNLISIDARYARRYGDLAQAFDAISHFGLIDGDGFTLICLAPHELPRHEFTTLFSKLATSLQTRLFLPTKKPISEHSSGQTSEHTSQQFWEQNARLLDFGGLIRHPDSF
jgi:hypothetical protein